MRPEILNAIARVEILGPGQPGAPSSWGTGFLIADGLVLTALHVVANRRERALMPHAGEITLAFPTTRTKASIVDGCFDAAADWALLRCENPPAARPLSLAELTDASPWETFGFPQAKPDGMAAAGSVRNCFASLEGNSVLQLFCYEAGAGRGLPVMGFSGSPVLVEDAVVGLLRFALLTNDGVRLSVGGTLYACPSAAVWQALERTHPGLLPKPPMLKPQGQELREPEPSPALHQLPPPPAGYLGRDRELADLRTALQPEGVTLVGLQGPGGVGKTAVALTCAAAFAPHYPDAQIYLHLQGASDAPLSSAEAMAQVIRCFRPEGKIPDSESEIGNLYRSLLHGKRVLLLLDNAADADQVKPLIPPPGCAAILTSRRHFTLPGLHLLPLESLAPAEAEALITSIAPSAGAAAADIARLCGRLPLALELAARTLVERVDLDPADYVRRLTDEKKRLHLLTGGEESVEASIQLSYALLDSETQARWRMLAVFPDTFDPPPAALIWKLQSEDACDEAADVLSRLVQCSMVEWKPAERRYRLHDLMRDFARAQLAPAESDLAARRHADHYCFVAQQSETTANRGGEWTLGGLSRFDRDWINIQAGQAWSAANSPADPEAARFSIQYCEPWTCLDLRLDNRQKIRWLEAAQQAAHSCNDLQREWQYLYRLGDAHHHLGEYQRAIEFHERALAVARQDGLPVAEAWTLGDLLDNYLTVGDNHRAYKVCGELLDLSRRCTDPGDRCTALYNLGDGYRRLGLTRPSIESFEQALAIARQIGRREDEANILTNLGTPQADLEVDPPAIEYLEQALVIWRELGDRISESAALATLGVTYHCNHEFAHARECLDRALALNRELGDRHAEAANLCDLASACKAEGDADRAVELLQQSLDLARLLSDRDMEWSALCDLGSLYLDTQQAALSMSQFQQALAVAREMGSLRGQEAALQGIGAGHQVVGDIARAIECFEQSLALARQLAMEPDIITALEELSAAYAEAGNQTRADECSREAATLKKSATA